MPKFRKKPVVVEAVKFDGTPECAKGIGLTYLDGKIKNVTKGWVIQTLEGDMFAAKGDWIITGVKGEKYPCKPDIFAATYEAYDEKEVGYGATLYDLCADIHRIVKKKSPAASP